MEDLTKRLNTEADQCANDGANDIATLLWEAAAVIEGLRTELANERASVHTCGPDCTRSGCVNARLRGEVEKLRAFHAWFKDHGEFLYYHFGMEVIDLFNAAALSNREGE